MYLLMISIIRDFPSPPPHFKTPVCLTVAKRKRKKEQMYDKMLCGWFIAFQNEWALE